jgi:hypothetical protein
MRAVQTLSFAAALVGTALLCLPAGAVEVCDKSCVGPLCAKDCVHRPDVTVGRGPRDRVIIEEERARRRPDVEIRERTRRPGVDIEIGR